LGVFGVILGSDSFIPVYSAPTSVSLAVFCADIGSPTYILSPVDFAANPSLLLQVIQKYKIKDTYTTSQMISHAMTTPAKNHHLHELKNIMIAFDQRPKVELCTSPIDFC